MKPGIIYVLVHPSDPLLVKVGRTTQKLERRIAQHNSDFSKAAGQIVQETGQKWELKEFFEVPDPVHAESAFWQATGLADVAYRYGVEVEKLDWQTVEIGLRAARNAGVRRYNRKPPARRNRDWMIAQLEGTGITMTGHYRGLVTRVEFECDDGHVFRRSPAEVAKWDTCPWCPPREDESGDAG